MFPYNSRINTYTAPTFFNKAVCVRNGSGSPFPKRFSDTEWKNPLRHSNSLIAVGKLGTDRPYAERRAKVPGSSATPISRAAAALGIDEEKEAEGAEKPVERLAPQASADKT